MTITFKTIAIEAVTCGECHVIFGLEADFHRKVKGDGSGFWCPNGHKIYYYETDLKRERKAREQAERDATWLRSRLDQEKAATRDAENRARAQKAAKTRIKNRIANGVCPCCQRSFQNVARHMANQHPEFVA